jgi:ferredoxin-thioredoxin reductase catalytic subunit
MNDEKKPAKISKEKINDAYEKMKKEIEDGGYHFNPDVEFTKALIEGLLVNEERYGYQSCPCRLSSGKKEIDLDIICPCDYRDPDLNDHDACYCGLFVSQKVVDGKVKAKSIPERRDNNSDQPKKTATKKDSGLAYPVWRCRVCGYLCARENPPEKCPVCKASKERFELFM